MDLSIIFKIQISNPRLADNSGSLNNILHRVICSSSFFGSRWLYFFLYVVFTLQRFLRIKFLIFKLGYWNFHNKINKNKQNCVLDDLSLVYNVFKTCNIIMVFNLLLCISRYFLII